MFGRKRLGKRSIQAALGAALLGAIAVVLASCGGASGSGGPSGRVRPVLVSAAIQGDSMILPMSRVQSVTNARFVVRPASGQQESFMAYVYGGQTYVRASICVPCGGQSYSLQGNRLICDTCGTTFNATTGEGVSGVQACMGYPKQPVQFSVSADGSMVMRTSDLLAAFQKTLRQ